MSSCLWQIPYPLSYLTGSRVSVLTFFLGDETSLRNR